MALSHIASVFIIKNSKLLIYMRFLAVSFIMLALDAIAAFPLAGDSVSAASHAVGETVARTINGTIRDRKGQSLIGATVMVKDVAGKSTVTDIDGNFTISGVPENCILQVSYVGFMPAEIKVTPDKSEYSITMRVNRSALDEVVVVGYATQKKVDLTGAVSSVSADALEDRPITNATNALAGLAAGLTVTNSG
ncbi:MAG: carboxypeptidase-like regulatory domain-containing protein, partial [Muribaculaceae bacterium]|nr:carboxypeptidase-like regulatory domain-containing protein [Muribaculaceae bacterium]